MKSILVFTRLWKQSAKWSILLVPVVSAQAQKTVWGTELQSTFIDISGVSRLNQPSQVLTLKFTYQGFFLDGYHSFSWQEPGRTIQTYFGPGILFANQSKTTTYAIKADLAFNRIIDNSSVLRPMLLIKHTFNESHALSLTGWYSFDTRQNPPAPFRGTTLFIGYLYTLPLNKWELSSEFRLVFVSIPSIRTVSAFTERLKFNNTQLNLYAFGNFGYSYYVSDNIEPVIYNLGIGKSF